MTTGFNESLKAEAFFLSSESTQGVGPMDYFIDCQGLRDRGQGNEVLSLNQKYTVVHQRVIELLAVRVSRNGIYQMLPEMLFQPLSLSYLGATVNEVVEEIRANRNQELGNKVFFAPFDTEFFHYSIKLLQRQLAWPGEDSGLASRLLYELTGVAFNLNPQQALMLLSFIANGERAKENPELLADFLGKLFGYQIRIVPVTIALPNLPTVALGAARLGVDASLAAPSGTDPTSNGWQDWRVEIVANDAAAMLDLGTGKALRGRILEILDFFVLAERHIEVVVAAEATACTAAVGEGRLGINAFLQAA